MNGSFPTKPSGNHPEDASAREERHQALAALLGAYADNELPVETSSQINAHLLGCQRCRNELLVQQAIGRQLAAAPIASATPDFINRIRVAITSRPPGDLPVAPAATIGKQIRLWKYNFIAALLACGFVTIAVFSERQPRPEPAPLVIGQTVPVISAMFQEYRDIMAGDLPGRARDLELVRRALPFDVSPLDHSDAHLLAAWTTTIDGEPAAVLAYRWRETVILQLVVAESLLFRARDIREAFAIDRGVVSSSSSLNLLAWPEPDAGSVLVGDVSLTGLIDLTGARNR